MSTYKVLQDIEAEDKLVGPLTLWQFIYGLGAGFLIYLSAIFVMKGASFLLVFTVPVTLFALFLAIPWGGDQPTEVWALAKLSFFMRPRKRLWDQSGVQELVTVTAPKTIPRVLTDGLSQHEVRSRLTTLATTLDSRGWAMKNVNVNLVTAPTVSYAASDRLVDVTNTPQEVSNIDIRADEDMLDEQANPLARTFDAMIDQAAEKYRQSLMDRMQQPTPTVAAPTPTPVAQSQAVAAPLQPLAVPSSASAPAQDWFTPVTQQAQPLTPDPAAYAAMQAQTVPTAAEPTAEEKALLTAQREQDELIQNAAYGNMRVLKTPEQIAEEQRLAALKAAEEMAAKQQAQAVTPEKQAAIMNLSRSNDLDIATIARQAHKAEPKEDEIVINLR